MCFFEVVIKFHFCSQMIILPLAYVMVAGRALSNVVGQQSHQGGLGFDSVGSHISANGARSPRAHWFKGKPPGQNLRRRTKNTFFQKSRNVRKMSVDFLSKV